MVFDNIKNAGNTVIKRVGGYNLIVESKFPVLSIIKKKFIFMSIVIGLVFLIIYCTKASVSSIEKVNKINKVPEDFDKIVKKNSQIIELSKIIRIEKPVTAKLIEGEFEPPGLEKNKSRNVADYIEDSIDTFSIISPSLCMTDKFLVNFVTSAPRYFEKREAIRKSWAESRSDVATYFVMGISNDQQVQDELIKENENYGDIIQENFIDTYNNLTLKSITILKVVDKFCANRTKYIAKVDDDVYLNVNLLLEYLSMNQKKDLLSGRVYKNVAPLRKYGYKWYCPRYLFNESVYPDYLAGAGYVMTSNVARILYKTTFSVPLLHIEDVYVTGMCAKKANIRHTNELRFTSLPYYKYCQVHALFTLHYQSVIKMRRLHKMIKENVTTVTCPPPK